VIAALQRLLRRLRPAAAALAPASTDVLRRDRPGQPIRLRVGMIVNDPVLVTRGGQTLSRTVGWSDAEQLAAQYAADLRTASGGIAEYTISVRRQLPLFPAKIDGRQYDEQHYLAVLAGRQPALTPDTADYAALLRLSGLLPLVESGQIDEIWLFGFPYAGYYESRMIGPQAIWCNAPPLELPEVTRRFLVMGFNLERDVGCMLENFGHRVESQLSHAWRNVSGERNLWERFIRYDAVTPGEAECGNVHFAPSSLRDYDWGNPATVRSRADSWYRFPDLSGPTQLLDCRAWGNGDMRLHHLWWLDHLPRVDGETDGIRNNWWQIVLQP
jgi:hypothetical protein